MQPMKNSLQEIEIRERGEKGLKNHCPGAVQALSRSVHRRLRAVPGLFFRPDCGADHRRVAVVHMVVQRDNHEHHQLADRARLLALRMKDRSSEGTMPLELRLS